MEGTRGEELGQGGRGAGGTTRLDNWIPHMLDSLRRTSFWHSMHRQAHRFSLSCRRIHASLGSDASLRRAPALLLRPTLWRLQYQSRSIAILAARSSKFSTCISRIVF